MEKEKFEKIVFDLEDRLELEIGINPITKEEGIKINGIPGDYDILFIRENRDEIIKILKKKNNEKVNINLEISHFEYKKLLKIARQLNISIEDLIIREIRKI